jgi:replicative DNA helicase
MQVDLEALTLAFQKSLNQEAFEYLQERGITEETIESFRIGYDPGEIGFTVQNSAHLLDHYFEHRIVFPVIQADGQVVDLIGRALDRREPKYKTLFGEESTFFNQSVLSQAEDVVLCQSVIDAITLHQTGIAAICLPNVMLFKDTHAKVLEGHRVIICMGNDEAGRREGARIAELLEPSGISGVIMQLPEGVRDVNDFFLRVEEPTATFVGLIAQSMEQQMVSPMTPDARHLTAYTEEYAKWAKQDEAPFWSTGYESLDEAMGGGIRQGYYLWSGSSECGKTALIKSIADEIALQGTPVLYLSWDLTGYELWQYSIARMLEMPVQTLQRGMVEMELVSEANKAYQHIAGMLWTMEGKLETSAEDVSGAVEHIVRATGQAPVIVVDQMLRLINPTLDPYSHSALITLGYVLKTWSQQWDTAVISTLPLPHAAWTVPAPLLATSDWSAEVFRRPSGGWRLRIDKNRAGIRGDLELN